MILHIEEGINAITFSFNRRSTNRVIDSITPSPLRQFAMYMLQSWTA